MPTFWTRVVVLLVAALGVPACNFLPKGAPACAPEGGPECLRSHTLDAVAGDIDHIEKHIDVWGSISTKHPDVWGAARMTKYQQEVERVFLNEVDAAAIDKKVLAAQGARARTDQAFLAQALSFNAALTGRQAALLPPDPITVETGTVTSTSGTSLKSDRTAKSNSSSDTESKQAGSDAPSQSVTNKAGQSRDSNFTSGNTSNVDDKRVATTSAPPAVTIPTDGPDLKTVVNSAINVKRNDPTIVGMPGFGPGGIQLEPTVVLDEKKRFLDHLNEIRRVYEGDDTSASPGYALYLVRVPVSVLPGKRTDTGHGAEIQMSVKPVIGDDLLPATFRNLVVNDLVDQFSELLTVLINDNRDDLKMLITTDCTATACKTPGDANDKARAALCGAAAKVRPKYTAARPSRHSEYAFPMNHLDELFDATYTRALIYGAVTRYREEIAAGKVVHLHEVRGVVREQVVAAYRLLATANPQVWSLCTPDLTRAIRDLNGNANKDGSVRAYRDLFDKALGREQGAAGTVASQRLFVEALAWGVMLESALLTEQLVRDMKETASHKGCGCASTGWQDYFHPDPSPEARRAFNEYVACRWPVYTFAVDPVTEQQNIQDSLSQRREMQLALSLAFASGSLTAQSFTRAARRLEADYQTIELNRTVVGFSHGDNTFGWRFYPRFQPPEIPGTVKVLSRDLLGGRAFTKAQEARERRLEPGQRECVALVIMPSFVPYAEVNVSSSWFNLNDPKCKSHSTKETVQLSRRLQAIETVCPKADHEKYLAGEFARLQAKAKMLAARLPLQDMKFPVPFENTLGGFEFFNSGVTDLAPQLRGWYGAPGYDGNAVSLYLMGDNFSVANTSVTAGGKLLPPESVKLLSRQVVSVTLPSGLALSEDKPGLYSDNGKFVDVRLATPYGVTGSLRVPALGPKPAGAAPTPALAPLTDRQAIALDRTTDLVLSGANLTADARVFAGGKACAVEVLSGGVLKVTVPKGVTPIATGDFVEVRAATAGGASNAILVPVVKAGAGAGAAAPKASFSGPTMTVAFAYKNLGIVGVEEPNARPVLAIDVTDPTVVLADNDRVDLTLRASDGTTVTVPGAVYSAKDKRLSGFGATLRDQLLLAYGTRFGPENVNPPVPVKLTATFRDKAKQPVTVEVSDGLAVQWVRVNPPEK